MLRFFFQQAPSPPPNLRFAEHVPLFGNPDIIATIIDNITDLPTLRNFICVFAVPGLVFAQYPSSILRRTTGNDLIKAYVASTKYKPKGQTSMQSFLKQILNEGCPQIPHLSNGGQVLEKLVVIDNAIHSFQAFLSKRDYRDVSWRIGVKPGWVSYLSSVMHPRYYKIPDWIPDWENYDLEQVQEALWHLEIYHVLFLTGNTAAYQGSSECLIHQMQFLQRLDHGLFWRLNGVCKHFRQTLNSPTLHHTQHRLYEILKLGHGLTRTRGPPYQDFLGSRDFCEKYLVFQLSLALPEMLRVFHYQWSGSLGGQMPDTPDGDSDQRSPAEVFQQRRRDWTLLWGLDAYEELLDEEETGFISDGFLQLPWGETVAVLVLLILVLVIIRACVFLFFRFFEVVGVIKVRSAVLRR